MLARQTFEKTGARCEMADADSKPLKNEDDLREAAEAVANEMGRNGRSGQK